MNRSKRLYVEELRELYKAENRLVRVLPKMAKVSTSEDLRAGLEHSCRMPYQRVFKLSSLTVLF
ncbi:MAG: DUF892 family protein [Terriglobia bacterium]